ncbi:hypothetical protein M885DRAFT_513011 [Pelagophyceae sp. CCMP2097]|nr:hypothetical protein M885DRAFT_513011 [Pelagophyceae sp. CCMP2097]|mmetsp:Transcript_2425/g.8801  ORF Transcript_2425/g.8801 Transcript_2425/m.8801 type:complete len:451 (+) Transcript_2425:182-1534(+)
MDELWIFIAVVAAWVVYSIAQALKPRWASRGGAPRKAVEPEVSRRVRGAPGSDAAAAASSEEESPRGVLRLRFGGTDVSANTLVPVKNAFFDGAFIVFVRDLPISPDHDAALFQTRKVVFEIQIQGVFLKDPPGALALAIELVPPYLPESRDSPDSPDAPASPVKMQLGYAAAAAAHFLLRFLRGFVPSLRYSFGTDETTAFMAADLLLPMGRRAWALVSTPAGGEPPQLGTVIRSDGSADDGVLRTGVVYTVSYYTPNMDMAQWALVNLPGLRDVSLRRFWRDSGVRLSIHALAEDGARQDVFAVDIESEEPAARDAPAQTTSAPADDASTSDDGSDRLSAVKPAGPKRRSRGRIVVDSVRRSGSLVVDSVRRSGSIVVETVRPAAAAVRPVGCSFKHRRRRCIPRLSIPRVRSLAALLPNRPTFASFAFPDAAASTAPPTKFVVEAES